MWWKRRESTKRLHFRNTSISWCWMIRRGRLVRLSTLSEYVGRLNRLDPFLWNESWCNLTQLNLYVHGDLVCNDPSRWLRLKVTQLITSLPDLFWIDMAFYDHSFWVRGDTCVKFSKPCTNRINTKWRDEVCLSDHLGFRKKHERITNRYHLSLHIVIYESDGWTLSLFKRIMSYTTSALLVF